MKSSDQNSAEAIFQEAVLLPHNQRQRFLEARCIDAAIKSEVEELLRFDCAEDGPLSRDLRAEFAPTLMQSHEAGGNGTHVEPLSVGGIDHGRFLPGTLLADRYRIVGMLGKGGMGEVYRADDLDVGQSVALKFLPQDLGTNQRALDRFRNEVRLARQVSHSNVCRVYDIGQIDGHWFLSMEYVDGEDLSQLLTRIGRFPTERATDLARQLCMGLHAAHEIGVLHRDLKPANIMIDGRGKLLITDFGLAEVAEDVNCYDIRSGTPAYMSPEQLAGREVTHRSDIYAAGMILHELYTGEKFGGSGVSDRKDGAAKISAASKTSETLSEVDPAVTQVITRCLHPEPQQRPESILSVVAMLPGGDPLQAALAAGEIPSPQMVANAGSEGRLSIRQGAALIGALCLFLVLLPFISEYSSRFNFGALATNKPDNLLRDAQEILKSLGGDADAVPGDRAAAGFQFAETGVYEYWYRESTKPLSPRNPDLWGTGSPWRVTLTNPPNNDPGMTSVRLDTSGKLIELLRVPEVAVISASDSSETSGVATHTWQNLFAAAGKHLSAYQASTPRDAATLIGAPVYFDQLYFWYPIESESGESPIVAASWRGVVSYFGQLTPTEDGLGESTDAAAAWRLGPLGRLWLPPPSTHGLPGSFLLFVTVFAIGLTIRNVCLAGVDLRNAAVFALFVLVCDFVGWVIIQGSLYEAFADQRLAANFLLRSLALAARSGLYYMAFEPFIRRWYPAALISSTRLISGRVRDSLVCRDVLVGCLVGVGISLVTCALRDTLRSPDSPELIDVTYAVGFSLSSMAYLVNAALCNLAILCLATVLLRNRILGLGLFLLINIYFQYSYVLSVSFLLCSVFFYLTIGWTYIRFGLLAASCVFCVNYWLSHLPLTWRLDLWYSASWSFLVSVLFCVGFFGFFFSSISTKSDFPQITKVSTP